MVKLVRSLQTKLTLSFVLLILIISGLTFFYTVNEAKTALKESLAGELVAVASVMSTQIDGDALAGMRKGDENTSGYLKIRDQLRAAKLSHPDIKYVYTMRNVGGHVEFIVDADYGNSQDPGAAIGEEYTPAGQIMDGFEKPVADNEFTTDEWGTFLSGYAPVKDSKGDIIGLVGVDMTAKRFMERMDFLGSTVYYILAGGIIVAAFIILYFSKTIINDINKLNKSAQDISLGKTDLLIDVHRDDEIGELADSFARMAASLKILMSDDEAEKRK